jgi:hypothetical protein
MSGQTMATDPTGSGLPYRSTWQRAPIGFCYRCADLALSPDGVHRDAACPMLVRPLTLDTVLWRALYQGLDAQLGRDGMDALLAQMALDVTATPRTQGGGDR